MKIPLFYRLLLSTFLLPGASCSLFTESGKTTVEGQVVDSVTGQGVGAAQVRLFTNSKSSSSAAYGPADEWRATDARGRFSFSFDADKSYSYILRATSRRGETGFVEAPSIKGGRKNKNVRVPVEGPGWVRIHLRDDLPRTDAINVQVGGFMGDVTLRPPLDTIIYRVVKPYHPNAVIWKLAGSRFVPEVENSIPYTVTGMDTARVDIRY